MFARVPAILTLNYNNKNKCYKLRILVDYQRKPYIIGAYTEYEDGLEAAEIVIEQLVYKGKLLSELEHPLFTAAKFTVGRSSRAPGVYPILHEFGVLTKEGRLGNKKISVDTLYHLRKHTKYHERHGLERRPPLHQIGPWEWNSRTLGEMCGYDL